MDTTPKNNRLSVVITFCLGILGYFRGCRGDRRRRCLPCWLKSHGSEELRKLFEYETCADNSGDVDEDGKERCLICDDLNNVTGSDTRGSNRDQDYISVPAETDMLLGGSGRKNGNLQYRTAILDRSSEEPTSKWCSRLATVLSFLWLLMVTILIVNDWLSRIVHNWGRTEYVLHMLSYSTYLLPLIVVALLRIIAIFYESRPPTEHWWAYSLTSDHVLTRLNILGRGEAVYFGYLCVLFPSVCVGFQIAYDTYEIVIKCNTAINSKLFVGFVGSFIGEFMFACFCYLIFLLRRCVKANLQACLFFLKKHIEKVDLCRQRILEGYADFLRLQNLISFWLVFQFSLAIFKVSCQIYWNYFVFDSNRNNISAVLINVMIWLEILMFLTLPPLAVGGFDILSVWDDFKLDVKRLCRQRNAENWYLIVKMIKELRVLQSSMYMTVFFSVLGIFSALQLSDQYAEYWHEDSVCANITSRGGF
ncbi:uncharacterized protein [Ptychodera flava]|uniref:uncharacterized protein n=1 Tax=Ptychodera flava TaxID=63121 RepID=UPI003969E0A2